MSKTKTLRKQRYRPVSEFDEVTLASKREYWRTKKREQRARLSVGKKKSKKAGIYKSVCTVALKDEPVLHVPQSECGPVSVSNGGSCQSDATQNLTKCMVVCKEEVNTNEESSMGASMVKPNGVPLFKGIPVPQAYIKPHPKGTETRKTPIRSLGFNGTNSCVSPRSAVSQFTSQYNAQNNLQMKCSASSRSLAFSECKVVKGQRNLKRKGTNALGKSCAFAAKCSQAPCKTIDIIMTEEEMVAKRRENWRIKKREQRAKNAQKLKMDQEKMQFMEKGQKHTERASWFAPTHALSSANTRVLRRAKQHKPVVSVDQRKSVHCGMEVQRYTFPRKQAPHKQQTVALKLGNNSRSLSRNLSSVSVSPLNHLQDTKRSHMSLSSRVSVQPLAGTQFTLQGKMQQQRFVHNQRRQPLPQGTNRLETADERLAKQREYWRIKKRQQRAKHSTLLKARSKERDAFNWRSKCYQSIMEQIRKTPTSSKKVIQTNRNMLLNTFKTNSGFFKDDSTISIPILETTAVKPSSTLHTKLPAVTISYNILPISQSRKRVSVRSRPALHSLCNNINSSMNIHQKSTDQSISAVAPLVKPNLGSSTVDAKVLTKTTQAEDLSKNDWAPCNSKVKICGSSKQEHIYPSIDSVYSLAEQCQSMDFKAIQTPALSPAESKTETEPSSNNDSQSTTLLVVASMKRLLEESLNSVVESSSCSIDEDKPCEAEDKQCHQEEKEKYTKPDLAKPFGVMESDFSDNTLPSAVVKQSKSHCRFSQAQGSAEGVVLSFQDSSLKLPCTSTTGSSNFAQNLGAKTHDRQNAVSVNTLQRGKPARSGKSLVPKQYCSPQARGGRQVIESSELQKKREYWRLMKRQQRARKAKEKDGSKDAIQSSQQVQRRCSSFQVLHPPIAQSKSHTNINNHFIQPTVTTRPTRVVLSPTTSSNYQPSIEARPASFEGQPCKYKSSVPYRVSRPQLQRVAPIPPTKPASLTVTQIKNGKPPESLTQITGPSSTKLQNNKRHSKEPANEELDPDETIRRRRMLWRIKKQEQRARKAAQEKELRCQTAISHLENNWSSNNVDLVHSSSSTVTERLDFIPEQSQTEPLKDADGCLLPDVYCADEPVSKAEWRRTYLMDYDPLNQLLVCMVCAEQQYIFSVEAVKTHIEETHPDTLSLDEAERQRILRDWDELVTVRERFFTNQLWQNSNALKEQSLKHTPEVEVILDPDDK